MFWPWKSEANLTCEVDIHSHLLPGIDDGSPSVDHSVEMLRALQHQGYKKVITTPHIHPKYPNSETSIKHTLNALKSSLEGTGVTVQLEAAAEYFVDDQFIDKLETDQELLIFGDNYVLVECSFISKPLFFESVIYKLKDKGYSPVLAHPERYQFLEGSIDWLQNLKSTGILFQVTLGSIGGYYGKMPKKIGMELIKHGMVDFFGSDLHKVTQVEFLKKGLHNKEVQNLLKSGQVLNNHLL